MSFLLVMPMVMVVFWIVLQVGLSTVAAIGAQQAASETAAALGDQRGPRRVCDAVVEFERQYGDVMRQPAGVTVSGSAGTRPACTAGWQAWNAGVVACDGDGDGTGAVGNGVEVVVDAHAIELLPALGDAVGIAALNRLDDVSAASCARVREAP